MSFLHLRTSWNFLKQYLREAVLSASLNLLFDKLASSDLLNFAREEGVLTELKKWETTLLKIHAVLNDAEEKQMTNQIVKIWLSELRDLAYDIEDMLDDFATENLRKKLTLQYQASTSKVRYFITTCTSLNPRSLIFNHKMVSKIKKITARLDYIARQKSELNLRHYVGKRSNDRNPKTSLVYESYVFGRDGDKEAIVGLLLRDEACVEFRVVPIVGMGGMGKTTLAQLVFNDDRVKGYFHPRAWTCVSEEFNLLSITKAILESITEKTCDSTDFNTLQLRLKEELSEKKFLLVLDDVWNENYEDWDALCIPFRYGAAGSKIIVTARNDGVAKIMCTIPDETYHLNELLDKDCLSLFAQHALGTVSFDEHQDLKEIGEEIAKRCRGLPLAAKTLGGLLRTKVDRGEWKNILESKIWDLSEQKSGILPALMLSYHHLPCYLKQYFAFCSIFPKDYEFDMHELVSLWKGEGFLQQPEGRRMEDLGCEYFRNLVARSFFQQSRGKASRFVMHDLINDLAQFVAGEICFQLEENPEGNGQLQISENVRHSAYVRRRYDVFRKFGAFYKGTCLRTFLALPINTSLEYANCQLTCKVLQDLLPCLRCLRVLSLSGYNITKLPDSIGGLKHLRYLNMSHTAIKQLPESVSALYNLQTLILQGCRVLVKLPAGLGNLLNLSHLDLFDTKELRSMPPGIGKLKNLQTVSKFIVGKADGLGIGELQHLVDLRGALHLSGLHHVVHIQDARKANLMGKKDLTKLTMKWSSNFNDSRDEKVELDVLDMLQPHGNLERLKIEFYGGKGFPSWIADPAFSKMTHLDLINCRKCTSLPSLGQMSLLKVLCIKGIDNVKSVGIEFYGGASSSASAKPFQSLEILRLGDMPELTNWYASAGVENGFPQLRELHIWRCPKLIKELPSQLPLLVKLHIFSCQQLAISLPGLPSLRDLNIRKCNKVVLSSTGDFTSLINMQLWQISELTCTNGTLMQCLVALEVLEISHCNELKCLWQSGARLENLARLRRLVIQGCPELVSLAEDRQLLPCNLECLEINNCANLRRLPTGLNNLMPLRELRISGCPKIVSFPEMCLPPMLRCLAIRKCEALEMPNCSTTCLLERLVIESCPLKFPRRWKLPTTLKQLVIRHCHNLEFLPEGMMHDNSSNGGNNSNLSLEVLRITGCSSLMSFPGGSLSPSLKRLQIANCTRLTSLFETVHANSSLEYFYIGYCPSLKALPNNLCSLTKLHSLLIEDCPGLESFPARGLPTVNLRQIRISNCKNLKSLPNKMQDFTSLRHLGISHCPNLLSFPDDGVLPAKLLSLEVVGSQKFKPFSQWGLHRLTSIRRLSIGGGVLDLVSLSEECLLPQSLTFLQIQEFMKLKSFPKWLHNLTSLEELKIIKCPKLQSLPKEGLPATLQKLEILECPLLEQFLKEKGENWPVIVEVPCIMINGLSVHELITSA